MLKEIIIFSLMFVGAFLMFLAGVGVLRMPDTFLRLSATAKAGTLGAGCIVIGAALYFNNFSISTRAAAIVVFLMLTAPVAAHMIGRAAYFDGVPLWQGTIHDDLYGHYSRTTHKLEPSLVPSEDKVELHFETDEQDEKQPS